MTMMLLDPNDEDGVCGAAYQEWRDEQWAFDPPYNPDEDEDRMLVGGKWLEVEEDNEWECD